MQCESPFTAVVQGLSSPGVGITRFQAQPLRDIKLQRGCLSTFSIQQLGGVFNEPRNGTNGERSGRTKAPTCYETRRALPARKLRLRGRRGHQGRGPSVSGATVSTVVCPEYRLLRQEHESALLEVELYESSGAGTVQQALRYEGEARAVSAAARNRLLAHGCNCPICRANRHSA
jgi:hypothetical protein